MSATTALGTERSGDGVAPTTADLGLTILYGSQTGNAEYLAHQIHEEAEGAGNTASVVSLEDWLHSGEPHLSRLLLVTATHDNGHMPDNAQEFWDWLGTLEPGALDGLPYAVLAIGDSMYDDFCKAGHDFDQRLAELGAERLVDSIDCDVDFEFSAQRWATSAVEALLAASPWTPLGEAMPASKAATEDAPVHAARCTARVVASRLLSAEGSAKQVMHYELEFDDGSFDYLPGDSLAIFPTNPDALIDEWIAAFGTAAPEVREMLRDRELRLPHPGLILALGNLRPDSAPIRAALELVTTDRERLDAWLWGRDVLDVLADLDCLDLPVERIIRELRPIQRRDYSIASSPAADSPRVHITVSQVSYEHGGRHHRGTATAFLSDVARRGDAFDVQRLPAREFHLPPDDVPVIMIGPGVGVAPFRAFMRHRDAVGATGGNWLFFGDQHRAFDWLYELEMTDLRTRGVLDRIDLAFSRDQAEKHYVQDEMRRRAEELRKWLDDGAYVFVCGDKARMAPDVDRALAEILGGASGASGDGPAALASLRSSGRYVKDVY